MVVKTDCYYVLVLPLLLCLVRVLPWFWSYYSLWESIICTWTKKDLLGNCNGSERAIMICHVKNAHVPTVDTNRAVQKVSYLKQGIFVSFPDKTKRAFAAEVLSQLFIINEKEFLPFLCLVLCWGKACVVHERESGETLPKSQAQWITVFGGETKPVKRKKKVK